MWGGSPGDTVWGGTDIFHFPLVIFDFQLNGGYACGVLVRACEIENRK